jgi:hypothetical protein
MNPPRVLSVNEAWSPLPAREWSPAAARHLLRRTGWAATPPEAQAAFDRGLTRTIDTLFPAIPAEFPAPPLTADLTAETTRLYRKPATTSNATFASAIATPNKTSPSRGCRPPSIRPAPRWRNGFFFSAMSMS